MEKSDQIYFSQNYQVNKKHSLSDRLKDAPSGSKFYSGPSCQNCGHPSHSTDNCWWHSKPKCLKCGYFGHLEKDCKNKHKGKSFKRKGEKKSKKDELKKKKKTDEKKALNFTLPHLVHTDSVRIPSSVLAVLAQS